MLTRNRAHCEARLMAVGSVWVQKIQSTRPRALTQSGMVV